MKSITIYSLQKHHFASKCCSRNAYCCFDNTGKIFLWGVQEFLAQTLKRKKSFVVNEKNIFVPKCSCEVLKSSFDNPPGIFLLKKWQQFQNLSILSQKISQNCTSGHVDWKSENNAEKFPPESIDFPRKVQKRWTEKNFQFKLFSMKTLIWSDRILL